MDRQRTLLEDEQLTGISDEMMAYLFTVKQELTNQPFQLQVADVKFVGFPLSSPSPCIIHADSSDPDSPDILLFAIIIAITSEANKEEIRLYQELSKRLGLAIRHEESRCGYLSNQAKAMVQLQEEYLTMTEADSNINSPYKMILEKCELAQLLKLVYEDVNDNGFVSIHINSWVEVSFCIPKRIYTKIHLAPASTDTIEKTLSHLRPYHGVLLLEDWKDIFSSLPVDASPSLCRLLQHVTPLKSLEDLSSHIDLPLTQMCMLVRHLVSWGKAIVIYPICENNLYVISPNANLGSNQLMEGFSENFTGRSLLQVLSDFSPAASLSEVLNTPYSTEFQSKEDRVEMVVWLLQRRLLQQIHVYLYLMPPSDSIASLSSTVSEAAAASADLSFPSSNSNVTNNINNNNNKNVLTTSQSSNVPSPTTPTASSTTTSSNNPECERLINNLPLGVLPQLSCSSNSAAEEDHHSAVLSEIRSILSRTGLNNTAQAVYDLTLFSKLIPYMNGEHHLEDIMYSENIRRTDIVTVIERFQSVIVTCMHTDSITPPIKHEADLSD